MAHLYLNVFTASKGSNNCILLNPKFQAPSLLLLLYRPVCVGPGEKPKLLVFLYEGTFIIENNFKQKKNPSENVYFNMQFSIVQFHSLQK